MLIFDRIAFHLGALATISEVNHPNLVVILVEESHNIHAGKSGMRKIKG
jgi:hypothetical protein